MSLLLVSLFELVLVMECRQPARGLRAISAAFEVLFFLRVRRADLDFLPTTLLPRMPAVSNTSRSTRLPLQELRS